MTAIDYVTRKTSAKEIALNVVDALVGGLLLLALLVMSGGILYMLK